MGIHPNTVRFYEKWGLITKPVREKNGYRVFTDLHLKQIQVARLGFEIEILQNGLRKQIVDMVKTCAAGDFDGAIRQTEEYLLQLKKERTAAEEAIRRMMCKLSENPEADIRKILDTPEQDDTIISACDRLLLSISDAEKNAEKIMTLLKEMKE